MILSFDSYTFPPHQLQESHAVSRWHGITDNAPINLKLQHHSNQTHGHSTVIRDRGDGEFEPEVSSLSSRIQIITFNVDVFKKNSSRWWANVLDEKVCKVKVLKLGQV